MYRIFADEYLPSDDGPWGRLRLVGSRLSARDDGIDEVSVEVLDHGEPVTLRGQGNGPIAGFCDALSSQGIDVKVLDYAEHALSSGRDATAASYIECDINGRTLWGVGIDPNIVTASFHAIISAVNRATR